MFRIAWSWFKSWPTPTKASVIALLLVGAIFFGLWLDTPGSYICNPPKRPDGGPTFIGFGCDAWLQSLSQAFGGVATLVAVLWTIRHVRGQEDDARRHKLAAWGFELVEARRLVRSALDQAVPERALAYPGFDDSLYVRGARLVDLAKQQMRIELTIYPSIASEISRLSPSVARRQIMAAALLRDFNTEVESLQQFNVGAQYDVSHIDKFIADCSRVDAVCSAAINGLEAFTKVDIERTPERRFAGMGDP